MKKTKMFMIALCVASMVLGMMSSASALMIIPGDADFSGIFPVNPNAADIATIVGSETLFELYKQDVGGPESGPFAPSYVTEFSNTPTDPEDATITYVMGMPVISGDPIYLLVKDGNHDPIWYIFNLGLTGLPWNGTDTIYLQGFWPENGAISHVSIYGPSTSVPEPTTLLLLGLGLVGVAGIRRTLKK